MERRPRAPAPGPRAPGSSPARRRRRRPPSAGTAPRRARSCDRQDRRADLRRQAQQRLLEPVQAIAATLRQLADARPRGRPRARASPSARRTRRRAGPSTARTPAGPWPRASPAGRPRDGRPRSARPGPAARPRRARRTRRETTAGTSGCDASSCAASPARARSRSSSVRFVSAVRSSRRRATASGRSAHATESAWPRPSSTATRACTAASARSPQTKRTRVPPL